MSTEANSTERATIREKANAWDRLMRDTQEDMGQAIYDAWDYLRLTVLTREDRAESGEDTPPPRKPRKPAQPEALKRFLKIQVPFPRGNLA